MVLRSFVNIAWPPVLPICRQHRWACFLKDTQQSKSQTNRSGLILPCSHLSSFVFTLDLAEVDKTCSEAERTAIYLYIQIAVEKNAIEASLFGSIERDTGEGNKRRK